MKKLIIAAIALLAVSAAAQRTTRARLQNGAADAQPAPAECTVIAAPSPQYVSVSGYDKPLRSRRETFFVTNNGDTPIEGIAFTINYFDSNNRQLHAASHNVSVQIPPSETRQVNIKSWDSQQSFYYTRSTAPARADQATPYDVKITVDSIFCAAK